MAELRKRFVSNNEPTLDDYEDIPQDNVDYRPYIPLSPVRSFVILCVWSLLIFTLGFYFNDKLPYAGNVPPLDKFEFNTFNALRDLYNLTNLGPRVTGSEENEIKAVNFLSKRIAEIKNEALPIHLINYDLQVVSGKFYLNIFSRNSVISYENIQNVVVKIGPRKSSEKSLLINCHFDSVPTSPGASDDGLNCAIMLEILRILAISEQELPHNIIFLFNGAEENPLIGSHGFITKHKWSDEVEAFINLESCGAGGREVLFQAGPSNPWLIEEYWKAALYPSGQVVAEEIFQSGLIPSDTDFRIFRDYGIIPGLDFAHCKNGYVYHTKLDSIGSIDHPHGVIKHTGENILALSKQLIFSNKFLNRQDFEKGYRVYYDILGLVFINYSNSLGISLNLLMSFLSLWGIYLTLLNSGNAYKMAMKLLLALTSQLGTVMIAFSYNVLIALLLDVTGYTMSWYNNTGLIILIYVVPTVVAMAVNSVVVSEWIMDNLDFKAKIRFSCLSTQLFWTILLDGSIFFNVRSSYLLLITVLPTALWTLITSALKITDIRFWYQPFILLSSFSSLMLCYLGITSLRLFIPITGRMGVTKNPEIIIGVLTTIFSLGIFSSITAILVLVKKPWGVIKLLCAIHITSFVLITTHVGFPFSINTPQRIFVTHVNRQFFNINRSLEYKDSLFWIQNVEKRGRSMHPLLKDAQLLDEFCEKNGYCGLPWFFKIKESEGSSCIPSDPHNLQSEIAMDIISSKLEGSKFFLEFNISGSDHMGVIITPSQNVTLLDWNMPSEIQQTPNIITFVHGVYNSSHKVTLEAIKPSRNSFIKIEVYGLYFFTHHQYFSSDFDKFLGKFPNWTDSSPALATYKSYLL